MEITPLSDEREEDVEYHIRAVDLSLPILQNALHPNLAQIIGQYMTDFVTLVANDGRECLVYAPHARFHSPVLDMKMQQDYRCHLDYDFGIVYDLAEYMTLQGFRKGRAPKENKLLPTNWRDYPCAYFQRLTSMTSRDRVAKLSTLATLLQVDELMRIMAAIIASWIKGKTLVEIGEALRASEVYVLNDARRRVMFTATCACDECK